ncbi:MAG: hypothetical protein IPK63_12710 [Candidatus Competibacteraceae bacterium]|nr:hypothetical protein [Candidatus Competibacteraceae bacterium]
MINAIRVEMLPGHSTGNAYFLTGSTTAHEGTVDTDLNPGIYKLTTNKTLKKWIITGVNGGIRFYVELDGADPWALNYAAGLRLEVISKGQILNPNEELLDGIGPDAYRNDPKYIDRVTAGHYDVATGKFTVDHEDGSVIELDYAAILKHLQPPHAGGATMYVYYRNLQNYKIYPRLFDKNTAPNIASMVLETEQARPSAEGLARLGRILLELVKLRASASAVGHVGGQIPAPARAAESTWKVVPKTSASLTRKMIPGMTGGNTPSANLRLPSGDLLKSGVQHVEGKVVYRVDEMIAVSAEAITVKAAHRSLIVAAAQEARRMGQATFKMLGIQANHNARRHFDKLAREIGVPNSGKQFPSNVPMAYPNYEVTLSVDKVLATNVP